MAWGLPDWLVPPSSTQTQTQSQPKSADGGLIAPSRSTREQCYLSRDLLFECLDRHNIIDAVNEDEKSRKLCARENEEYERDCAKSWIKYFKEKRVMEWKRDRTIEKIQEDDAKMAEKARRGGSGKGWFT